MMSRELSLFLTPVESVEYFYMANQAEEEINKAFGVINAILGSKSDLKK